MQHGGGAVAEEALRCEAQLEERASIGQRQVVTKRPDAGDLAIEVCSAQPVLGNARALGVADAESRCRQVGWEGASCTHAETVPHS